MADFHVLILSTSIKVYNMTSLFSHNIKTICLILCRFSNPFQVHCRHFRQQIGASISTLTGLQLCSLIHSKLCVLIPFHHSFAGFNQTASLCYSCVSLMLVSLSFPGTLQVLNTAYREHHRRHAVLETDTVALSSQFGLMLTSFSCFQHTSYSSRTDSSFAE